MSSSPLRSGRVVGRELAIAHALPLVLVLVDGIQWRSLPWLLLVDHLESTEPASENLRSDHSVQAEGRRSYLLPRLTATDTRY